MASKWSLGTKLASMFGRPKIDDDTWDDLESTLLSADFGPDVTDQIIALMRERVAKTGVTDSTDVVRHHRLPIERKAEA